MRMQIAGGKYRSEVVCHALYITRVSKLEVKSDYLCVLCHNRVDIHYYNIQISDRNSTDICRLYQYALLRSSALVISRSNWIYLIYLGFSL